MTDEAQIRQRAIAGIIKGVAKKTALLTVGAAIAVLVYTLLQDAGQRWWLLPASVLFGGALGLLNFRWLATAVERVYLRKGATPGLSSLAAAVISILKLSLIFIILFMVIKWRLLHIFGMVAGLSLSFLAIVWEGAKLMKQTLQDGGSGR
jgi:hypothetical protein